MRPFWRKYAGPPQPYRYEPSRFPGWDLDSNGRYRTVEITSDLVRNIDGVEWADAPVPPRRHSCWPQTVALGVARCACGATRAPSGMWIERNSR